MAETLEARPHGPQAMDHRRLGRLKHGNPPGDPRTAPRCSARTRRGTLCQAPAMRNGRCQFHGGKSTGPRTPEGIESIRRALTKHGRYTNQATAQRRYARDLLRRCRDTLALLRNGTLNSPSSVLE